MFYDMYMRGLERNLDCLEDPHPRLINLEPVLEDAKIFYIDDLVKDSLINSQFNFADNDPGLNKLPFPSMFFEFESGLEYRTLEGKISDSFFINS